MTPRARTLGLALTLGLAAPAHAYEFLCHGYYITGYSGTCPLGKQETDSCGCANTQPQTVPKWFNGQLSMIVENQGGNGVNATAFVTATRNAAQSWTDVTCSFAAISATQTMAANNAARFGEQDNEHGVFFVTTESEWIAATGSGGGGTLGVTLAPYRGFGCNDREFYDADILINGFILGGWTATSLEETLLHEQGHALGLGHPCLLGMTGTSCSNTCSAVMAASGGDFTTPQQDDVNAICALYQGTNGGLGSSCTSNGQCTSNRCVTYEGFSYCTQTCGTCATGYVCTNVGGTNVCTRKGAPSAGEACTSTCAPGATCVGDGAGGGLCRLICNPASPSCTGADRCATLEDGSGVCWPPGTLQVGEDCSSADCAAGLSCVIDAGTEANPIAHCYVACDEAFPTSCGTAKLCYDLGDGTGICLQAALENQNCVTTDYVCVAGFTCAPPSSGTGASTCRRKCDYTSASSCGTGQTCARLNDTSGNPIGGACYPAGTGTEGASCVTSLDCLTTLSCVGTGSRGECLVRCTPPSGTCPHGGQSCVQLAPGQGVCSPANGTDPPTGPGTPGPTPSGACACDVSTACDPGCADCDPECKESTGSGGCASGGGSWLVAALALVLLTRRRNLG